MTATEGNKVDDSGLMAIAILLMLFSCFCFAYVAVKWVEEPPIRITVSWSWGGKDFKDVFKEVIRDMVDDFLVVRIIRSISKPGPGI